MRRGEGCTHMGLVRLPRSDEDDQCGGVGAREEGGGCTHMLFVQLPRSGEDDALLLAINSRGWARCSGAAKVKAVQEVRAAAGTSWTRQTDEGRGLCKGPESEYRGILIVGHNNLRQSLHCGTGGVQFLQIQRKFDGFCIRVASDPVWGRPSCCRCPRTFGLKHTCMRRTACSCCRAVLARNIVAMSPRVSLKSRQQLSRCMKQ